MVNDFQLTPATEELKEILTIFGLKGAGKTSLAMLITDPDSMLALSFDMKTLRCKTNYYGDRDIDVYNATQYLRNSIDEYGSTAAKCYDYTKYILENSPEKDWVLFDGGEIMAKLCEQKMRMAHQLKPFQGFSTLSWWNERNMFLRTLHDLAKEKCRKGVIYTIFSQMQEVEDFVSGMKTKEVPRWMDAASWETDVVLHAASVRSEKDRSRRFHVEVTSSKILRFPTGVVLDVTDKYRSGWGSVNAVEIKFSDTFEQMVGWYVRRGADRDRLVSHYTSDGNGSVNEQKWIDLAARHKDDEDSLKEFIREVNSV